MTSRSSNSSTPDRGLRLDAYLAHAGLASRKEARLLIRKGHVMVDGEPCRDSARRVTVERVALDEDEVASPIEQTDFLLHKPVGFACSHDEREAPLVFDLLDDVLRRRALRMAGRLDRATSGLLILTTDGDFVHQLTHPTRKVEKRYRIEFEGTLVEDAAQRCRDGFMLRGEEKPTLPSQLEVESESRATLVLREGRTHQVRRMIKALGGEVTALHRDRVGRLDLPEDLEPGELRPLPRLDRERLLSESSL